MNATKLIAALTVILLFSDHGTAQTPPSTREAYEALAGQAGLTVIFSRTFRASSLTTPVQDLDSLAKQTSTFFTHWDKKTIFVLEDNQQNRRDFDRQFVQTLALGDKDRQTVIDDLRGRGFKQVVAAGPGNTIFVRDTPAQIRLAENIIATPNQPAAVLDLDGLFLAENGGQWRTPETLRSQLKIKTTAPVTLGFTGTTQTVFENLASSAGVNVLFGRGFRPIPVTIALKDVGFFEALDRVSFSAGTFWQPINENTFRVVEDNQQNRRDFDAHSVETIYLPGDTSSARMNEILSHLRGMLALRGVGSSASAKAIVIHDTPGNLVLAETMIAEMTGQPIRKKMVTDLRTSFGENGAWLHTAASDRARLQIKTSAPGSIALTGTSRDVFETLAASAGLQVVFSAAFRAQNISLKLQDVDVIDAMDYLAVQTGTFWQVLDARTIHVLEDNQQNRRSFQTHLVKTIYLPKEIPVSGLNEIVNLLRTNLTMRGIMQHDDARAILIHDTPHKIALAETLIEHLNTFPTPSRSVTIPAPHYAENRIYGIAAAVRPGLSVKASGPVSINLNQDARATYEALADIAGIRVNFSQDFRPGSPLPFKLQGVDILDALDYFSLVTTNSWKVVDRETILVFPETQQNHRDLDTQVVKTFAIANKTLPNTVNSIANVLRTAFAMRGVEIGDGFITVQDTPERILLAEKAIASLDRAP
jgi:hypothetical protein